MNVAIHSHEGDTLSLALRLQEEGHAVGFFVEKDGAQRIGNGLVYRITDFPALGLLIKPVDERAERDHSIALCSAGHVG